MRNLLLLIIIYVFVSALFPGESVVEARRGGGRARYSRYRSRRYDYGSYRDSSNEYDGGSGGGLGIGSIVAIVICFILIMAAVVVLIYFKCR